MLNLKSIKLILSILPCILLCFFYTQEVLAINKLQKSRSFKDSFEIKTRVALNIGTIFSNNNIGNNIANKLDINDDAIIYIYIKKNSTKINNGIKYGINGHININKNKAKYGDGYTSDQFYEYLEFNTKGGSKNNDKKNKNAESTHRFEIGILPSVTQRFSVNAASIYGNNNIGINGNMVYFINTIIPEYYSKQITTSNNLWNNQFGKGLNRLNSLKLNYIYQQKNNPWIVGLSYIPRSNTKPLIYNINDNDNKINYTNVVGGVISYVNQYNGINYKLGISTQYASGQNYKQILFKDNDIPNDNDIVIGNNLYNLQSTEVGANIGYMGFIFGASYGYNGKSGLFKEYTDDKNIKYTNKLYSDVNIKPKNQKYHSLGLSYSIAAFTIGITHISSYNQVFSNVYNKNISNNNIEFKILNTQLSNMVLSMQYQMKQNLTCYIEFGKSKLQLQNINTNSYYNEYKGNIIILGAKIKL